MRSVFGCAVASGIVFTPGVAWAVDPAVAELAFGYSVKDAVTLAIALLGAGLGVYNAYTARTQRLVRVRVEPKFNLLQGATPYYLSVVVVNNSTFPISVEQLGFVRSDIGLNSFDYVDLNKKHKDDNDDGEVKRPPYRVEARSSIEIDVHPADLPVSDWAVLKGVYVRLADGTIRKGRGDAFKNLISALKKKDTDSKQQV